MRIDPNWTCRADLPRRDKAAWTLALAVASKDGHVTQIGSRALARAVLRLIAEKSK